MSAALYNDAAASAYGNTPLPDKNGIDLGIIDGNRLNLLPEHAFAIYVRCLNHLAMCQLSSRCTRVFYTILNQTVGFKKLEDNITTTRLEQLTKIRHDHAGQAMKDLVAMNLLMHRIGGKHRNWLSVNFNLVTWGNPTTQERDKNNDPTILLPRRYIEEPIDQGIALHLGGEDFLDLPVFNPPEIEANIDVKTEVKAEVKTEIKTETDPKPRQTVPPATSQAERKQTTEPASPSTSAQPSSVETQTTNAVAIPPANQNSIENPAANPAIEAAATTHPANSTKPSPVETQAIKTAIEATIETAAPINLAKQNPIETQDIARIPHISEILSTVIPLAQQNSIETRAIDNPAIEAAATTFTRHSPTDNAEYETPSVVEISPTTRTAANKNAAETSRTHDELEQTLTQTVTALVEDKMQQLAQLIEDKLQCLTQAPASASEQPQSTHIASHQGESTLPPHSQTAVKTRATPAETQAKQPSTNATTSSSITANQSLDVRALHYPQQLNSQQCEALHKLLHQCGDQAQNVLNLLAQRFENTQDPIQQPVAYFATLVERLQINKLDLSAAYDYKIKNTADIDHQKRIDELQVKYRGYRCDYRHFARVVERDIAQTGHSFAEASEETNMTLILDDLSQKIKQTETALDQLMTGV